jgi:hypothetical protein
MVLLISTLLCTWLCLTLARQLGEIKWHRRWTLSQAIQRHDVLQLIPSFYFFAPNPPMFEFELLYRDCLENGTTTAWRALDLYSSRWWRPLWNPEKRRSQVAFRLCSTLIQHAKAQIRGQRGREELYVSAAYVALACRVTVAPHTLTTAATQFLIAISPGFDARKGAAIAFVSPAFRL